MSVIMHLATIAAQAIAVVASAAAAWLWLKSARVPIPTDTSVSGFVYEGHPDLDASGIESLGEAMAEQGRVSSGAATCSGIAAGAQMVALLLQAFGPWS